MYNVHFNSSKKFEFVKFVELHEIMIFFREEQDWQKENYMRIFFLFVRKY